MCRHQMECTLKGHALKTVYLTVQRLFQNDDYIAALFKVHMERCKPIKDYLGGRVYLVSRDCH